VAGDQHGHPRQGRGFAVELAGRHLLGDQTAHQIVAGITFFAVYQLLDVPVHRHKRLGLLLVGCLGVQTDPGVALEGGQILFRHSQQQRDHQRWHR
jgi:hypothetical protein